ncbi:UvrD-helicase domain-containing protein [Chryseobacterium sp.]|uniref:UvrD-helicase domain-containing protein n=1 Tax=Chryseobacterium sp. TaxID=1871047 RepID=UPI002FC58ED6
MQLQQNNKLIIAAAGSGKTTFLIEEAIKQKKGKVLITTFTQANESEIKRKFVTKNKCIPENITVQTWFSFLLKHGVKPYQGALFEKKINGLILVNGKSGLKAYSSPCEKCKKENIVKDECTKCKKPIYFSEEKNFEQHYFSKSTKIYSDKLSKFVIRSNEKSKGELINRISKIYSHIFIDEVQDLAGYDLELLKLLFNSSSQILMVGDPRQGTYVTNISAKNKQFTKSSIVHFFQDQTMKINTDKKSLLINYRCNKAICDLSNDLFPKFQRTESGNEIITGHDGVFFIKEKDVENYLLNFNPMQLRDNKRKLVNENFKVMNFGESKGLSFDRVLIYPTQPFLAWLVDNKSELAETSRSKLYVALTRARYSVAIVNNIETEGNQIKHYKLI